MRILHVIIGLNVGGAELMLKRLAESQNGNKNCHCTVISLTKIGVIGSQLQAHGIDVYSIGMRTALGAPYALWQLARLIRNVRPDIVQTWMYHADVLGGLAARLAGIRHIIWGIRTTDIRSCSRSTSAVRWICALLSKWLPSVIVCAAEASKRTHISVGYAANKMVVVPNGYDFYWLQSTDSERRILREECGIRPDQIVVGCLGRFHTDKDQENFVRAAGFLAPQYSHLRFLMVGSGLSWTNVQLVNWINNAGCRDSFILMGERADVPQCLSAMDIFCLPSRTEGFPNVLAEAMAMALPCVTTDVGDAASLLSDSGIVVAKEDSMALAKGLEQLLMMSQENRLVLGQKAKIRVHAEFSMTRCTKRFDTIYQNIVMGSSI